MKLILFLIGLVLSVWVGFTAYAPVNVFVTDIKGIYLRSKVIQNTTIQKSETVLNALTDKYQEIARVF